MMYIAALIFCIVNIFSCYALSRDDVILNNDYKAPASAQTSWVNYPSNKFQGSSMQNPQPLNTHYLDDLISANIEQLLRTYKGLPLNRYSRDDSAEHSEKPAKPHRRKVKTASLRQKPKTVRPVEESEEENYPGRYIIYRANLRSNPSRRDSTLAKRSNLQKITSEANVPKAKIVDTETTKQTQDTPSENSRSLKQLHEDELMQTYRLLYKLFQTDPLFGLGYGFMPTNLGVMSSLTKEVEGTQKVTREDEDPKTKKLQTENEKETQSDYENSSKKSNIETRSVPISPDDYYAGPILDDAEI